MSSHPLDESLAARDLAVVVSRHLAERIARLLAANYSDVASELINDKDGSEDYELTTVSIHSRDHGVCRFSATAMINGHEVRINKSFQLPQ